MIKYLMKAMTGMAAIALCGVMTGCSNDLGGAAVTVEENINQIYEDAFVTRFGQPAADQNWGFGDGAALARTRAVVASPSVSEVGYTFNAQMAMAWKGVEAAIASGTDANYFTFMDNYKSWKGSGWEDKFYQINATVVASDLTDEFREKVKEAILEEIPENVNNLSKAQSTGYTITTTGGPVTLTPVYHNSNSGDLISYYYYPAGTSPDVKTLPKYTIGNMADPNVCNNNHTALNNNTYSLVYVDANGNASYNFPANYVINFMVSNTWTGNGSLEIYKEGGMTETTEGSAGNLEVKGKYSVSAGDYKATGGDAYVNNYVEIRYGNTLDLPNFKAVKEGTEFSYNGTTFKYYTEGNGVNGSLDGGSTCYYLTPHYAGTLTLGVALGAGKTLKVYKMADKWGFYTNPTATEVFSYKNNGNTTYHGPVTLDFETEAYELYAVYAEGSKLGFYGCEFHDAAAKHNIAFTSGEVGTSFSLSQERDNSIVHFRMGKTPLYFTKAKADGNIDGYSAYTPGTTADGGLTGGATTYYFKAYNPGTLRVAVALNAGKTMVVKKLGNAWNSFNDTSGSQVGSYTAGSSKYYGTYEFPMEGGYYYAVYAEGSKLGFYGCEFLQAAGGTQSSSSVTNLVKKSITNNPEYYGNGAYNTAIHTSGLSQWTVSEATTPHTAVFSIDGTNYVGFEDWTDLDYNDVIFAVTGTTGGKEIEIEDEGEKTTPTNAICRIIGEDLTVDENSDFDFNDVVFDVIPNSDGATTTIRLRAAGGTLPLYIAGQEVHAAFNVSTSTMVNTGWDGTIDYEKRYVDFTISGYYGTAADCINIPITVTKKTGTETVVNILLKAEVGKAASKVAVGTDYKWCSERQDIDKKYHKADGTRLFTEYVRGNVGSNWYKLVDE